MRLYPARMRSIQAMQLLQCSPFYISRTLPKAGSLKSVTRGADGSVLQAFWKETRAVNTLWSIK